MQQDLAGIEQAIAAGTPVTRLPVTAAQWRALTGTLLNDEYNGGVAVAHAILVADHRISHSAWVRVAVAGGVGLVALLLTIVLTTLVGRGIIRRLRGLESTALTLAEQQLPDVVTRLRHGEDVDPATEAPPLQVGQDEIGRVGQAFDLVRRRRGPRCGPGGRPCDGREDTRRLRWVRLASAISTGCWTTWCGGSRRSPSRHLVRRRHRARRIDTLGREDAEHLAALAAGFQSLARGAGRHFGGGAGRQAIIEMESGYLLVSTAGSGTCLAVIAAAGADPGLVAYEMTVLVRRSSEHIRVNGRMSALSGWD